MKQEKITTGGLQAGTVIEASKWLAEEERLKRCILEHKAACKHWGYEQTWEEEHRDAQFPARQMAQCSYCGKTMRLNEFNFN